MERNNQTRETGMANRARRLAVAAVAMVVAATMLAGCGGRLFDVNLTVVGEQTSLERQVLGNYDSVGEDLRAYSGVRAVGPDGQVQAPPATTDSRAAMIAAMRNREYNRGDVQALLAAGIVGEGNDGMLAWRSDTRTFKRMGPAEVEEVVAEENADRGTIIDRLVTTTPGVGEQDRQEVRWILAGRFQEEAPFGAWVQARNGAWMRK